MKKLHNPLSAFFIFTTFVTPLIISFVCCLHASAQLTGVKYIPGDYATVTLAVNALNASGPGSGGATFNVAANYTETIVSPISLTATGTVANPIVFQKDPATTGANPLITAYTGGTATPMSSVQDGIWRISGSDYVTINGIDVRDNPANATNPSTMEYGYALYKPSSSNGCKFVTIKNCTVTLSNVNNASSTNPMTEGSSGILVMNASATSAIVVYGNVAGGGNSNNKFYSNTIQNCNYGISMVGALDVSPFAFADTNNDIGGVSAATGNTILNFGGASGATNASAAIRAQNQYGLNVSYNTVNNNNGSGTNHTATLRGILINSALSASCSITHNTITLKGGGTTTNVTGIENAAGNTAAGNTVVVSDNSIINSTYTSATSGHLFGIYNSGSPATLTINNNIISNNSTSATANGTFYGVYNLGAASIVTMNGNTFSGNMFAGTSTGSFCGVYNTAAAQGLFMNGNTVSGNSTNSLLGPYYAIYNSGAVTNVININSNNVGTSISSAITFNAVNSVTSNFIYNSGGTANTVLSISNNNIQGINFPVGGTGANNYILNNAATLSQSINSNTFTNLNVNTSGTITFISNSVAVPATGTQNVNGNSIVGTFTKTGSGSNAVYLFNSARTCFQGSVINNNNNNFSNISIAGLAIMNGWVNTDSSTSTKTIQNNIFSNWVVGTGLVNCMTVNLNGTNNAVSGNRISNISGAGPVTGITTAFGNDKIFSNTIDSLFSSGAFAVTGVLVTGGTNKNIYSNKIYDLEVNNAGGTVSGITVQGATIVNANIYNNLIGNLRSPIGNTTTDVVRGISLTATALNSTINVYYNTVYLNATSTGTNFSSSGIYHTTNGTATTATLNLRNNIITNTSTPNGSGLTAAYRRSNSTLANYASTSNNNLFHAGTPAANRLLFYDATNSDQTLSSYKTRVVARDALSVTEDMITGSKFLSVLGASASFLHLDSTKATQAENGAVSIANFTTDYDGLTRHGTPGYSGGGNAPDIGADELNGIPVVAFSGTYNVGAGQTFTSLTNAGGLFAAINNLSLKGNVVINITSDLSEDGSNVLNQWVELGTGNYTLTVQPDASVSRIISGNVLNGMIRFNGAKRVIIDGSNGTTSNYLTFRNTNTAGTTSTAFTFINGATSNTIKYCNVEAYTNATNGVILFGSSTMAGGNSNNLISNCNINATLGGNTGSLCIYSAGTAGNENSTNTISNNNLFNYRDKGLDIAAIGSKSWVINNNSFYNGAVTGSINYAANSILFGLRILGGPGYSILNNYIGGSAALATGSNANYSSTLGNVAYYGILVTAATGITNIKGNVIRGITISSVPSAANANEFVGIETIGAGIINVGGTSAGDGNMIGSNTINGSIIVNTNTSAAVNTSFIRGIDFTSSNAASIVAGNQIGGFDITNTGSSAATAGPSAFQGITINTATPPSQVSNNIVGSTGIGAASNSVRVLSSSTANSTSLTGLFLSNLITSAIQVNANIIQNMSQQVNTVPSGTLAGISNNAIAGANVSVTNNIIKNNSVASATAAFYGIFSSGNPSSVSISGDTISNNTSTAATSGLMYGIYTAGTPSSIVINNNTFSENTTAALTSGLFAGIYNAAAPATLNIISNTFHGNATTATSGSYYPVYQTGAVTSTININSNNIGTATSGAITYNAANSGTQNFINNTGGLSTAALSISNNNFQGITYAVAGTGPNTYILNTATTLSQAINGNVFTNLNVNTSGNITFISSSVSLSSTGSQNVNNNSVSGTFTKAAGGNLTLFTSGAASASGSIINNNNNNFSNITVLGATTIAGWQNTDAGASTKNIQNNTFGNWTGGAGSITAMSVNISGTNNATSGNLINNISSAGPITGISTGRGNDNIYLNTINTLSSTGGAAVTGIIDTAGTTKNIYKNKIYDLQATTGTVNGILVTGGTTVNIFNNLIGNLRTPAASASDPIRGISVTSVVAPSTINVYYNTVYLNATSTGTNFGTTGVYHTSSATATTSLLNLRNNSITNTSTPNGSGYTVCYRLNAATYANYAPTSDNNLFYAGTPGTRRLIFWEGATGDQMLDAYKTRVATRDASSVTEDITAKFLSTTGSSPVYLHMDSTIASVVKNGAVNIAGYTNDYDGQIRFGNAGYTGTSSAPSIGADEAFGVENVPPTITYTALANTTSTANRAVTGITIADASGINTAAGTKPRIYYKRFSDANVWLDNTSSTNGWKYAEATNSASPYTFTIDYSVLSSGASVTAGAIQYFVVAQDLATIANIAINSGTFATPPSSVALTSTAFPIGGSIKSYNIAFSGTYNVGSAEVYTSLTKADGLFAAINSAGLMGNTTFNITSDLAEDGTNALSQWAESGAGNYTVTIKPDAAILRTISGSSASGLIRISGADRVTIDGSNSGSGVYLSFINTSTAGNGGSAFIFVGGAANNNILYCNVEAYTNAPNSVILFSTSTVAGGNSNNLIDNCKINATVGSNTGNDAIYSSGTVGNENTSNTISNSSIFGYKNRGLDISASGSAGWTISGNSFYNGNISGTINYPVSSILHGIRIQGGKGYSVLNNYIGGSAVAASGSNALYSSNAGNVSFQGISVTTTAASPASNIKGNTIAAISVSSVPSSAGSAAFTGVETIGSGINIGGTSVGEGNLIGSATNNSSIIITTSTVSAANTTLIKGISCASTGGIIAANQVGGVDINNIGAAPASSSFTGLFINTPSAPSQVINNIVGSRETSNSIQVLSSSIANATSLTGVLIGSAVNNNMLISGNMIGNISQLSLISSGSFSGINNGASSGTITIGTDTVQNITAAANDHSNSTFYNGIASSTASSISNNLISHISLSSTGINAQITGINVSGAFAHTITGNVISDLTTASSKASAGAETSSPSLSAVTGILNRATVAGQMISGNTLYNLNATNTSAINTIVTGIGITATVSGNIYNNRIASFTNQATGSEPGIIAVMAAGGLFNLYNNSIKIDNAAYTNGVKIYGITHAAGSNWNYFHNSISIGGTGAGTAMRSAAFIRPVSGSLFLRNNVFVNTRTGNGSNYAISNLVSPPSSGWSSSASDYNDLYSSNANTIAEWGLSNDQTFAQWQTSSGGGANSVSNPFTIIASPYDLQPDFSNCSLNNSGTPITSPIVINTDANNALRSAVSPDMGAYEFDYTAFVATAASNSPVCLGSPVNFTADPGIAMNAMYTWTNPSGAIVSTVQNPNIAAVPGTYTVKVTDDNGCFSLATTDISITPTPTSTLSGPGFICSGDVASLNLTLSGSGTIIGILSSGDIFSGPASTITVNVSPSVTTSYYITSLIDANCTARSIDYPDTAHVIAGQSGVWSGAISTDYNNAANWLCGGVPTAVTNITIPADLSFYPTIDDVQAVHNITIEAGASLTVTGTLKIAGFIANSGTFAATDGSIEMNGTTAQTIAALLFTGNGVKSLTINNSAGVTLQGSLGITDVLTVSNGTFNTGGYLTLKSSLTNTARVAPLPVNGAGVATSVISGLVSVERYISNRRAWRMLTSPLSNTGNIFNSWQNGGGAYVAGKGTLITGPNPSSANGLDASANNAVTMKSFNSVSQAFSNIIDTKTSTLSNNSGSADNIGYFIFIRGDRNPANTSTSSSSSTTLTSTGTLQTGKQVFAASGILGKLTLLGNPYASPVSFNNVSRTHIMKRFYAWDPHLNQVGGYVVLDDLDGDGNYSKSVPSSDQDEHIQSGQSFFVITDTAGPADLIFYEGSKSSNVSNAAFRLTGKQSSFDVTLNLLSANGTTSVADAAIAEFNDAYSIGVNLQDAAKFVNINESVSLLQNGKSLAIERRPFINAGDTVFLSLAKTTARNYRFVFNMNNVETPGLYAELEDKFTGISTPLNIEGATTFDFSITTAAASANGDRFRIIFRHSSVLPVIYTDVTARQKGNDIEVNWKVKDQQNIAHYEVEKSIDGLSFTKATVQPVIQSSTASYNWIDLHTVKGDNYYRIRNVDKDGAFTYSKVVKVVMEIAKGAVVVYPNPVTDGNIRLQLSGLQAGKYTARLVGSSGQVILVKEIAHTGSNSSQTIALQKNIAKGMYMLHIERNGEKLCDVKVMVQ